MTKMGGLQVHQVDDNVTQSNVSPTMQYPGHFASIAQFEVCTPASLAGLFTGVDNKYYLRQQKITVYSYNNSNTAVFLKIHYMRPRKQIPISQFSNINSILTFGGIVTQTWLTSITTSNNAQRWLKFGKIKTIMLKPGAYKRWSLKSPKYGARLVNGEVEVNVAYLASHISKFAIVKVIPAPIIAATPNGAIGPFVEVGTTAAQYFVKHLVSEYTSFYQLGNNDPATFYTDNIVVPPNLTNIKPMPLFENSTIVQNQVFN